MIHHQDDKLSTPYEMSKYIGNACKLWITLLNDKVHDIGRISQAKIV